MCSLVLWETVPSPVPRIFQDWHRSANDNIIDGIRLDQDMQLLEEEVKAMGFCFKHMPNEEPAELMGQEYQKLKGPNLLAQTAPGASEMMVPGSGAVVNETLEALTSPWNDLVRDNLVRGASLP